MQLDRRILANCNVAYLDGQLVKSSYFGNYVLTFPYNKILVYYYNKNSKIINCKTGGNDFTSEISNIIMELFPEMFSQCEGNTYYTSGETTKYSLDFKLGNNNYRNKCDNNRDYLIKLNNYFLEYCVDIFPPVSEHILYMNIIL